MSVCCPTARYRALNSLERQQFSQTEPRPREFLLRPVNQALYGCFIYFSNECYILSMPVFPLQPVNVNGVFSADKKTEYKQLAEALRRKVLISVVAFISCLTVYRYCPRVTLSRRIYHRCATFVTPLP
jgi:hypothetical protein